MGQHREMTVLRNLLLPVLLGLPLLAQADVALIHEQAVLVQTNPAAENDNVEDVDEEDQEEIDPDALPVATYVSQGGYAVTGADIKDVATIVFDFQATTSVTAATLRLPISEYFPQNDAAPVTISFFSDNGVIEVEDYGIGFVEPLAEIEANGLAEISLDVTGPVNSVLQGSRFVGFRIASAVDSRSVEADLFPAFTGIRLADNPVLEFAPGAPPATPTDTTNFDGFTLNVSSIEAGGVGEVRASFQLVDPNSLTFELRAAELVSGSGGGPDRSGLELLDCAAFEAPESVGVAEGIASFSTSSGVLDIPSVDLYGKQVTVRLEYIEGTNPWLFETLDIATVQSGPSGATVSALGGGLLVEPAQDFLPLCHGWVMIGDFIRNRVVERNLITGETGGVYQLNTSPGQLILDEPRGVVHMTVHPESERLYTLDLASGDIEWDPIFQTLNGAGASFTYGFAPRYMTMGEDGNIFAIMFDGVRFNPENDIPFSDTGLWLGYFDGDGNFQFPSLPLEDPVRFIYDPVRQHLVGATESNLATFTFNPATNTLTAVPGTDIPVGSDCTDLDISPDGNRIAYTCPNGNYPGEAEPSIADMDPLSYYNNDGEWYFGTSPVSAVFNADGTLLYGVDAEKLYVFDVKTHLILEDYELGLLAGETIRKLRLSKDGELLYLMLDNDNHENNSKFYWMPTPNITGTPL